MEHKACCENYLEKQMENFSRLLEDYFDNILQEFIRKNPDFKLNGYTFNRNRQTDIYHFENENYEVYATPFYDADDCLNIQIFKIPEYHTAKDFNKHMQEIQLNLIVSGNAEKDLQHYFEVMKKYLV